MIDAEHIALFFGTAAGVFAAGYSFGKAAAWIRALYGAA
jgi:hypothetical protein